MPQRPVMAGVPSHMIHIGRRPEPQDRPGLRCQPQALWCAQDLACLAAGSRGFRPVHLEKVDVGSGHQKDCSRQKGLCDDPEHVTAVPGQQTEPPVRGRLAEQTVGFRLHLSADVGRSRLRCFGHPRHCASDRWLACFHFDKAPFRAGCIGSSHVAKKDA